MGKGIRPGAEHSSRVLRWACIVTVEVLSFRGMFLKLALTGAATLWAHPQPTATPPQGEHMRPASPDTLEIVGGTLSKNNAWPSAVALEVQNGLKVQLCAGTAIASDLVVTAAHCIAQGTEPAQIRIIVGNDTSNSRVKRAASWAQHPKYCGGAECPSGQDEAYDFAYVVIDGDLNLPEYPRPIVNQLTYDRLMAPGNRITLVGFGEDEDKDMGKKREVVTTLRGFTPAGRQFSTAGQGKDSCRGDSGGPAYALGKNGTWWWVGVLSAGDPKCGGGGYYGAPFAALDWLKKETGYEVTDCTALNCLRLNPKAPHADPGGEAGACSLSGQGGFGGSIWGLVAVAALLGWRRHSGKAQPQ